MRRSWSIETLLFLAVGAATILTWEGNWIISLIGVLSMGIISYYLSSALKKATILEYIEATQKTSKENKDGE